MEERTRVAGILKINGGYAFMHRKNVVKEKDCQDYYTFIGGGLEGNETPKEGLIREMKEELGIIVKPTKKLYETRVEKFNQKEIFFLCEYVSGEFGTGDGEEFDDNPAYKDNGEYVPEIIKEEDIENLLLLPTEIKEKFVEDLKNNAIG